MLYGRETPCDDMNEVKHGRNAAGHEMKGNSSGERLMISKRADESRMSTSKC